MRVACGAASILILSAATVWAQTAAPETGSAGKVLASGRNSVVVPSVLSSQEDNKMTKVQAAATLRQRTQEMQDTLNKMHELLRQMRASSNSNNSLIKANIEMWELMLSHLDKQVDQLRVATLTREDLEARRAAMYKQAMARTAIAGRGARGLSASQALAAGNVDQSTDATGSQAPSAATSQIKPGATADHHEADTTLTPVSPSPK